MAALLKSRSAILAKIESTYDTDPTPTAGNDAIYVEDLSLSWPTEVHDLTYVKPSLGPVPHVHGRKYGTISFKTPLKGSGTAGTAADWGPVLRACGFGETIVPATSVTYAPVSSSFESVTIWAYRAGLLYKFNGCRGDVQLELAAGQVPYLMFTISGHCVDVLDASLITPTVDTTKPVSVTSATFTLGGYAAVISKLALQMNNQVTPTDDCNHASGYGAFEITGRNTQGSFDPQATLVATHDFWSNWEDGTEQALSIVVGSTAGNIATITAPKCVHRELNEGDRNNVLTYDIPFTMAINTGDDEISIAMT